jgi:acetyltransferase-like isoleucine patch superfamily enzyme
MKGLIILDSDDKWHEGFIQSPFLISVKNVNIVLNQVLFLKLIGCTEIRIFKDSLSYQAVEREIGDGSKWGGRVSYGAIQKIARQDLSHFYKDFIKKEKSVIVKGLYFFNLQSRNKITTDKVIIIDEDNPYFIIERLDSFKKLYEMNVLGHKEYDIHRFDYAKAIVGPYLGNNTVFEDTSKVGASCLVGHECLIEENTYIGEGSVVGHGCKVGNGSIIKKCVVLDHILISRGMYLSEYIIGGDYIYSYKTNHISKIDDVLLLDTQKGLKVSKIDKFISGVLCTFFALPMALIYYLSKNKFINVEYKDSIVCIWHSLLRILEGKMEMVGASKDDLAILGEESNQVPEAMISICNPNDDDLIKRIHLRYYMGIRESTGRLNTFKMALKR